MDTLSVLIGETEDVLVGLFTEIITEIHGKRFSIEILDVSHGEELQRYAEEMKIDLFMVSLNNLRFEHDNLPSHKRIKQAVKLVAVLKDLYNKPIITYSGLSDIEKFFEKDFANPSDVHFTLPVKLDYLREVVRNCIP